MRSALDDAHQDLPEESDAVVRIVARPEDRLLDAVEFAHTWIKKLNDLQRELLAKADNKLTKWEYTPPEGVSAEVSAKVKELILPELKEAIVVKGKA